MDQPCEDTDLYPHIKNHKFKKDGRGAFYAIHSKWLGPNHVNTTASEAEAALQMSMYDGEMEQGKVCIPTCQVHIIIENLKEYGYQVLDLRSNVQYLLNGFRYEKLSTAVATVKAHPDKYEKDFDAVVAFLTQYMDKWGPA